MKYNYLKKTLQQHVSAFMTPSLGCNLKGL